MPPGARRRSPLAVPSKRRRQRAGKRQGKPDWKALEGLSLILGFVKWCAFAACVACLMSGSSAWPWLVVAVAAWIGASWARRRSDRALFGPKGPSERYMPTYQEPPRRPLGTMESILIGVLLGGMFFGGDEDGE